MRFGRRQQSKQETARTDDSVNGSKLNAGLDWCTCLDINASVADLEAGQGLSVLGQRDMKRDKSWYLRDDTVSLLIPGLKQGDEQILLSDEPPAFR